MSMQNIQLVLCRAVVDSGFRAELLAAPVDVLGRFDLEGAEIAALTAGYRGSLTDLAGAAEAWRRGDPSGVLAGELALAS